MTNKTTTSIRLTIETNTLAEIDARAAALNMARVDFMVQAAMSDFADNRQDIQETAQRLVFLNRQIDELEDDLQSTFRERGNFAWQALRSQI